TFKELTTQQVKSEAQKAGEDFFERRLLEAQTKARQMIQDIDRLFNPIPAALDQAYDLVKQELEGHNPITLESAMDQLSQLLLPFVEHHLTQKLKAALEPQT